MIEREGVVPDRAWVRVRVPGVVALVLVALVATTSRPGRAQPPPQSILKLNNTPRLKANALPPGIARDCDRKRRVRRGVAVHGPRGYHAGASPWGISMRLTTHVLDLVRGWQICITPCLDTANDQRDCQYQKQDSKEHPH